MFQLFSEYGGIDESDVHGIIQSMLLSFRSRESRYELGSGRARRLLSLAMVQYLSGKKISVYETAYLVGFSNPGAFSRAFKRWTGSSPGMMRASKVVEPNLSKQI